MVKMAFDLIANIGGIQKVYQDAYDRYLSK